MHRDLKPMNILVTNWDAETDIPVIKLADFGLAGINPEHKTICGTEGYIAPEVNMVRQRIKELKNRKNEGMKITIQDWLLTYTNAIDVWALGKILHELVEDIPSYIYLVRGKKVPVNKTPPRRLIDRMMQTDPKKRPTAAECLEDSWMSIIDRSEGLLAQKRGRSPTSPTSSPPSSVGQPLRKMIRRSGSTFRIMSAIWPPEMSEDHSRVTQLNIQLEDDCRLSLESYDYSDALILDSLVARNDNISVAVLADSASPQEASCSMQDVARRLLAALQAEGYGNNVTIAGNSIDVEVVRDELSQLNILSLRVRQESEDSMILELEFERKEGTGSFWNEGQSLVNHSQSVSPANPNATVAGDATSSCLQLMFSQVGPPSSLNASWAHQQESFGGTDQLATPIITFNNVAITSWTSEAMKGVTYPSDDIMAGISF